MYLKLNNRNWKKLCRHEIDAEQQKMNFNEEGQIEMKLEDKENEK